MFVHQGNYGQTRLPRAGVEVCLSPAACKLIADIGRVRMLERVLELPSVAEEGPFFEDGCPEERLMPLLHHLK